MIEHLVISTVFLAAAMVAAHTLPVTARTRHALLLLGLVKFVVPTGIFDLVPREAVPTALRTFGGGEAVAAVASSGNMRWLPIVWGVVACALFGRWLLLRSRTVATALRAATAASPREIAAVDEARRVFGIPHAVDVIRSPIAEAPAVLRIIRPVITLPAGGCEDLDEREIHSIILHECAHVTRRDNLVAVVVATATSLLWFHPLVWLASRLVSVAREEACDEKVADATGGEPYLSAIRKMCSAITGIRTAGVSCMASGRIAERMEHLMNYETLKSRALSHRLAMAVTIALVTLSAVAIAEPAASDQYELRTRVHGEQGKVVFTFEIVARDSERVVKQLRVATEPNLQVTAHLEDEVSGRQFTIEALGTVEQGTVVFQVKENGKAIQRTTHAYTQKEYSGQPMSLNLKNADIRDVLKTFEQLTGLAMLIDADVTGSVTIDMVTVPWDQALETVLRQTGNVGTMEGKTLHVSKQK